MICLLQFRQNAVLQVAFVSTPDSLANSNVEEYAEQRGVPSDLKSDSVLFLQQGKHYFENLSSKLKIPIEKLGFYIESLRLIDSAYRKRRPAMTVFFRDAYLYLIAYLGEVYMSQKGGEWCFEREQGVESYVPSIKLPSGTKLDTYMGLMKECFDNYKTMNISLVAEI
ncbi:MAG: hypothetical protein Q8937_16925 [Bacteroidota bacterium]|nr:hypothetical protein [Bacteroidota bacterium]